MSDLNLIREQLIGRLEKAEDSNMRQAERIEQLEQDYTRFEEWHNECMQRSDQLEQLCRDMWHMLRGCTWDYCPTEATKIEIRDRMQDLGLLEGEQ